MHQLTQMFVQVQGTLLKLLLVKISNPPNHQGNGFGPSERPGQKLDSVGDQGKPPQNMPQWHIDYFELKLLKQPNQWDTLTLLSVFPKVGNKSLM